MSGTSEWKRGAKEAEQQLADLATKRLAQIGERKAAKTAKPKPVAPPKAPPSSRDRVRASLGR
jgi:hypothetical protein